MWVAQAQGQGHLVLCAAIGADVSAEELDRYNLATPHGCRRKGNMRGRSMGVVESCVSWAKQRLCWSSDAQPPMIMNRPPHLTDAFTPKPLPRSAVSQLLPQLQLACFY